MTNFPSRSFGVNEKAIKRRRDSVASIGKITKAMKMVSAAKMKGDLTRLASGKNFGINSVDMIFKSDTYMQRKAPHLDTSDVSELLVPLTSDKGLCGGINSSIVRELKSYVKNKNRSKIRILPIGEKGSVAMIRPFPDLISQSYSELPSPFNYPTAMAIAELVTKESENSERIVIYYNEF